MLRFSFCMLLISLVTVGCSNSKVASVAKTPPKDVQNVRMLEKTAKPSPYKSKTPRQVTAVNRDSAPPPVRSRNDQPLPE